MPKFLIVSATSFETEALVRHFQLTDPSGQGFFSPRPDSDTDISVVVTGVGMVNTAYALGRIAGPKYDHVINAGICGAFNRSLLQGEVVQIVSDTLSELGAEDDTEFIPYNDLKLGGTNVYHEELIHLPTEFSGLKRVSGITVNTVHGNATSIQKTIRRFSPDVESMEGAAFFRATAHLKGSRFQIRSVSNYVEKRDRNSWNIPLALANLNTFLIPLINRLNT